MTADRGGDERVRFQDIGIAADGGRVLVAFLNNTVEPMSPKAQSAAKAIWRKYKSVKDTGTSPDVAMSAMPIIPNQSKPATRMLTDDATMNNTKPKRRKPNETIDRLTRMEHVRPPAFRSSWRSKNPIHRR